MDKKLSRGEEIGHKYHRSMCILQKFNTVQLINIIISNIKSSRGLVSAEE